MTTTPTIKIETITSQTDKDFYSVWFWLDGDCVHVGHFDTRAEAQWAGDRVIEAVELTRHAIRKAI